ncbi:hypothetical protein ACXR8U_07325 [Methylobacterium radiotolerans]|jgi:hypothetical protein|uniref:hypothetical protein n=1 Tax=Methylobacterium TaxID=407 RepID=UPI0005E956EC|nr:MULTISPECIES: hypothetical protein [Methylobacterium]GAN52325.1 hypothetical protein ME121_6457 [Methylobacterium sp. ME121]MBN6821892.1 hypothetical protein [Methylobacterium organophilum]MDE3747800.1 hypothetical protein [Methylobacterium radiotolerans]OXE40647.1 hypothetical protein CCS92_17855 [Methylobacterium radiotolerans]PVZ05282.1 hypothetical protein C7388_105276 [Methylobacterium organophilum]
MHFEILATGRHLWTWVLLDVAHLTVMESDRTSPSEAQGSAALAFSKLVTRAGKTLTGGPAGGLL